MRSQKKHLKGFVQNFVVTFSKLVTHFGLGHFKMESMTSGAVGLIFFEIISFSITLTVAF